MPQGKGKAMEESKRKKTRAVRRAKRVRARILGVAEKPRLSVFRSNKNISAQLIDDVAGRAITAVSSLGSEIKDNGSKGIGAASLVGIAIAKKAKEAGIETCVFDRGRYKYHGRVKALAEGARKEGLRF